MFSSCTNTGTKLIENATLSTDPQNTNIVCVMCNFTGLIEENQCFVLIENIYSGMQYTLVIIKSQGEKFGVNCTQELPEGIYTVSIYDKASLEMPIFVYNDRVIKSIGIPYSITTPSVNSQMTTSKTSVSSTAATGIKMYFDLECRKLICAFC